MREDIGEFKLTQKWIHRECERDVDDLVQPTQHSVRGRCAVCGKTFGAVWLNEVEEAEESIPEEEVLVIEDGKDVKQMSVADAIEHIVEVAREHGETVIEAVSEPSEPIEPEPELEVIAVLEEVTEPEPIFTEEYLKALDIKKKAEIARLRAQIEALEK